MMFAPIVVTVYHRPDCLAKCIESLAANTVAKQSELYVISDAASRIQDELLVFQVREYARTIQGFKAVHLIFNEQNMGGHVSAQKAISQVFEKDDRLIFLEDDVIVAPDFLEYINDGLRRFKDDKRVFSIAGYRRPFRLPGWYKHDVFFLENFSPWGFGFWRDRYDAADQSQWDRYSQVVGNPQWFAELKKSDPCFLSILKADSVGRIQALDVRYEFHIHKNHLLSVFPSVSRSDNVGFDSRGEHCGDGGDFNRTSLNMVPVKVNFEAPVCINNRIARRFYAASAPKLWYRVLCMICVKGFYMTFVFYTKRLRTKLKCWLATGSSRGVD